MQKAKYTVLAVDDEKDILETVKAVLKPNYNVLVCSDPQDAPAKIRKNNVDIMLLDIKMPLYDGITLLKKVKSMDEGSSIDVVMLTALNDPKKAVEAIKAGAYDYICKPFEVEDLKAIIARALERKELLAENKALKSMVNVGFEDVIGRCPQMMEVMEQISSVAFSDASVVITGDTGCGKELIAKTIHKKSKRAGRPFFAVNCAAIPENLFESEFFGYEKGAFTGAFERHAGKFEAADKSTLFLDEIGCLPLPMQAKLLRVIQESEVQRLGSAFQLPVDVRLISATNVDLRQAVKKGSFRSDLYFRLNVVPIQLPSLRQRQDDIILFLDHFLAKYNKKYDKNISGFSEKALQKLREYAWPGNIRELENTVERLVLLCKSGSIGENDILSDFFCLDDIIDLPLKEACEKFEKDYIEKALNEAGGNQSKASRALKIDRTTLLSKVRRYL